MRNSRYHLSLCALALLGGLMAAPPASAQQQGAASGQQLSSQDKNFLDFAAQANQQEIRLGVLAVTKAEQPATKAFGRFMAQDHIELESQLAALVNAEHVEVPNGIGQEGRQMMQKLQSLNGLQFDREYMQGMVQGHTKVIQRFEEAASKAQNPSVRRLAAESLPILQQHLALAQAVEASTQSAQTIGSGRSRQ
jgi:putative membrane protein